MDQENNLLLPVFSVLAILTFFFVITSNNYSNIFASGFNLNKCSKPDYKEVYNCYYSPTCSTSNKIFGYGFGLKKDSLAAVSNRRDGWGYGYCMNFNHINIVRNDCLVPEFKKVYECDREPDKIGKIYNYCGDQRLAAIKGIGYGYGFAKDSNFSYKRSGMGFGKCVSYIDADYYTSNQSTFYFYKYLKCLAGINNC